MRWKRIVVMFLSIWVLALTGCNDNHSMIHYQIRSVDENLREEKTISDENQINKIESIIHEIEWQKGIPAMVRTEDVSFWFPTNKEITEIEKYRIWYSSNSKAEVIHKGKYGHLNSAELVTELKSILQK